MSNQEIAKKYLRCFCDGDIEGIESVLAPNLNFTGTLYSFHSSDEYLKSLRKGTLEKCRYKILSITENKDSVAIFYEYQKPKQIVQIAQLFKIKDQKIYEMILVFDGRDFTQQSQ